jgi:hypothetical protein
MTLRLRKFDMSAMKPDRVSVMIGMRNRGKSFLVKDLLWHHKDIPSGTVMSGIETMDHFYSRFIPSECVHDTYDPQMIETIVKHQRTNQAPDPRTIVVMDDCVYDHSWIRHRATQFMFMHSRSIHTTVIMSMQYAMGFPPNLRSSIDYVFLFQERIMANRRRLYEQFGATITDFDTFLQILDTCGEYECIVIDNTTTSNALEDILFWYKAAPHPDFHTLPWSTPTSARKKSEEIFEDREQNVCTGPNKAPESPPA